MILHEKKYDEEEQKWTTTCRIEKKNIENKYINEKNSRNQFFLWIQSLKVERIQKSVLINLPKMQNVLNHAVEFLALDLT